MARSAGAGAMFDVYQLPEEHEAIREAVREVCTAKVAPNAAAADETGRIPAGILRGARAADFHAPHIPTEYGGAGADALATAIVIEEVARACASSSLIPAVNKLGTMPLLLAGSEELKQRYLPPVARGEAMFSYCLSEPEAGSDAAVDEDPGGARRRPLRAERRQAVDHQRRASSSSTRSSPSPTRRPGPAASPRSSWRSPTPG